MTPIQIKKLDFWIGIPLVFILTLWRTMCSVISCQKSWEKPPSKIIFIKLTEQGSTVLAFSAIQKAIEMVGKINVYIWVFEENKSILEILNVIPDENIITIRNKGFLCFVCQTIRGFCRIREHRIDTAIDMEFFSRSSAILAYGCGAHKRVGFHRYQSELPYRGNLMTHKIQYNPHLHTTITYRLMVESLQQDPTDMPLPKIKSSKINITPPIYTPVDSDVVSIKKIIEQEFIGELVFPLLLINPNASDLIPVRRWDTENFIILSQKLIRHFDKKLTIIITGSPVEMFKSRDIFHKINSDRVMNLAGKTDLKTLFALYSIANVLITNDSGPGHFASMTNIKNIVLFGPETPLLFGPLGQNSYIVQAELGCRPCVSPFNHRMPQCKNNLCMQSISVDTVFEKILEVI